MPASHSHPRFFGSLALILLAVGACGGFAVSAADAPDASDRREFPDAGVADAAPRGAPDAEPTPDAGVPHRFDEAAANPGVWTWVHIEGAYCRDGSPSGLGLRIHRDGRGLILFMQGGGACMNAETCAINRPSFDASDFAGWTAQMGDRHIFNAGDGQNPVRDWHAAFVPYCTGDLHGGTRTGVNVPGGPRNQSFVGFHNMALIIAALRDYFPRLEHVLLVGSSAGGLGTVINYVPVAEAFAPAPVTLLDDSGPFLPNDRGLAPCLQQQMRQLWGLDDALPAGCTACFSASGDGLENLYPYLGATYPHARFGLLTTTGDLIVRTAYGYGRNDCNPLLPLPITVSVFQTGLFALRSSLPANWGTYYAGGPLHAILATYPFLTVDGVTLRSWFADLIAGRVSHVTRP